MNKYRIHFILDGKERTRETEARDYFAVVDWFWDCYPNHAKLERVESLD
jgi:hypothetical protein